MKQIFKNIYFSPSIDIKGNIQISENIKTKMNTYVDNGILCVPGAQNTTTTHNFKILNTPISKQDNKLINKVVSMIKFNEYLSYGLFYIANIIKKIYKNIGDNQ